MTENGRWHEASLLTTDLSLSLWKLFTKKSIVAQFFFWQTVVTAGSCIATRQTLKLELFICKRIHYNDVAHHCIYHGIFVFRQTSNNSETFAWQWTLTIFAPVFLHAFAPCCDVNEILWHTCIKWMTYDDGRRQ